MKRFKIGFAAVIAVLAMSFTVASHDMSSKKDTGFWTKGAQCSTSNCFARVTASENGLCTSPTGTFCYYTVTEACTVSGCQSDFTFSSEKCIPTK